MFGIFKKNNPNLFKDLNEFSTYCLNEFDKDVKMYYNKYKSMEGTAVMVGLNSCFEKLKERIPQIAVTNNWTESIVEEVIRNAFRKNHDKFLYYK
jgi:hypothetical protein